MTHTAYPHFVVTIFLGFQKPGELSATSDAGLSPCLTEALVDRCGRRAKLVSNALGSMPFGEKAQDLPLRLVQPAEFDAVSPLKHYRGHLADDARRFRTTATPIFL